MNKPVSPYAIQQAMSAWQSLRARLSDADPEIAAEVGLLDEMLGDAEQDVELILARLLRGSVEARDMAEGAKNRAAEIKHRQKRYEDRADAMRGTAFAILDALGRQRVELPDLTASVSRGGMATIITDETMLPDEFVRVKREPNRDAINAAVKVGQVVPGVETTNAPARLMVRTR